MRYDELSNRRGRVVVKLVSILCVLALSQLYGFSASARVNARQLGDAVSESKLVALIKIDSAESLMGRGVSVNCGYSYTGAVEQVLAGRTPEKESLSIASFAGLKIGQTYLIFLPTRSEIDRRAKFDEEKRSGCIRRHAALNWISEGFPCDVLERDDAATGASGFLWLRSPIDAFDWPLGITVATVFQRLPDVVPLATGESNLGGYELVSFPDLEKAVSAARAHGRNLEP